MACQTASESPIPYELRIGVTGHRKLSDAPAISTAVRELIETIDGTLKSSTARPAGPSAPQRSLWDRVDRVLARVLITANPFAHSDARKVPPERQTPLHWTVVSPLAKSADRIVARTALDGVSAEMEVITPFPVERYKRDFREPDDLAEFEELYKRRVKLQELRGDEAEGNPEAEGASDDQIGYLGVGMRVIESCELLIAIWDGKPRQPGSVGGTAHIVELATARDRNVLWVHATNPDHPVQMWNGESWVDLPTDAKSLSLGFHRISAYNRDPAQDTDDEKACATQFSDDILGAAKAAKLDKELINPLIEVIQHHYARADHLSGHYQNIYTRSAGLLHTLPALAVFAIVVQQLYFSTSVDLIVVEAGLMVLALVLLRVGAAEAWHEKWLNDRHLAERFRTKAFVWLFQSADTEVSPNALPFYRGPEHWIEQVVQSIVKPVQRPKLKRAQLDALKAFVLEGWVRDQAGWHAKNARRRSRRERRLRRINVALFAITLGAAVAHLLGIGHLPDGTSSHLGRALTMLAITGPAVAASVYGYRELLDLARIAERSRLMSQALTRHATRIENAKDLDQLRAEVGRVEELTASENLEWLSSLSFRELPLVT